MIDVGLVGLDSSHPEAFAEQIANTEGATVACVWDGGAVRSPEYSTSFCDRYDATLYDDVHDVVDEVDAAMVLTVNWDTHRRLAIPFLERGVPTLVDKPVAGRLDDVEAIADAANGTPLFGGSAIPFHPSLAEFPRGAAGRTLYCAGYNDPFYYGVHLTDALRRFVDADWTAAEPRSGPGVVVDVRFENGTRATLRLDGPQDDPAFGFLDVGDRTRTTRIGNDGSSYTEMYGRYLDAFLETVRGDRDDSGLIVDGARLLLAVNAALETGDVVGRESDALEAFHADGEAFLSEYAPYG